MIYAEDADAVAYAAHPLSGKYVFLEGKYVFLECDFSVIYV